MAVAEYRFLPWTRRGLSAEVGDPDPGSGSLPARANVQVGLTVTGADPGSIDLALYGPGDVLGLDPEMILRTDPRANATDVEPNYFPSIEFDPPDLPWMFTPAGPGDQDRLRPWLVLVCVDRSVVDDPQVTPGAPLPTINISAEAATTELADLGESWAWAHTQVARDDEAPDVDGDDLAAHPTLNVSRIMCPRRLVPGRNYMACLVPAFDVGVVRGLTGQQPEATEAAPAWTGTSAVTLPVYYHWNFSTGPGGDFEQLARKLRPWEAPATLGSAPMHVGAAGPGLPVADFAASGGRLDMTGALQSPSRAPGELSDVKPSLRQGLTAAVNAAADDVEGPRDDGPRRLGPPLYGGRHVNATRVPSRQPSWLRELNVDPRRRAAAAIGTDLVKANQEDFMHSAWEQVGEVLFANQLMSWARLAEEAARRLRARHLEPLPHDAMIAITRPLQYRVTIDDVTIGQRLHVTSVPDAITDPALRRLTSSQRPLMKRAFRLAELDRTASGGASIGLVRRMAAAEMRMDPAEGFTPDGLGGLRALDDETLDGGGDFDLAAFGLDARLPTAQIAELRDGLAGSAGQVRPQLVARPDLGVTGIVTEEHVRAARELVDVDPFGGVTLGSVIGDVLTAGAKNPGTIGFLVDASADDLQVLALDVAADGNLSIRTDVGSAAVPIGRVSPDLVTAVTDRLTTALGRTRVGTFPTVDSLGGAVTIDLPTITADPAVVGRIDVDGRVVDRSDGNVIPHGGRVVVRPGSTRPSGTTGSRRTVPPAAGPDRTTTIPPLVTDGAVIGRFRDALNDITTGHVVQAQPTDRRIVPFPLETAATLTLTAIDPVHTFPRRLSARLTAGAGNLLDGGVIGVHVPETHDRIWASPTFPVPLYDYLARHDPNRFIPGVEAIPENAVTLLETNPTFIESFMVGVNHEMNRELLWRGYPTDARGTPFRSFWSWLDGQPDIDDIHTWPGGGSLSSNTRGSGTGQLVLLIRGELLRRYPNTIVYGWRSDNGKLKDPPGTNDIARPVFAGRFDPDFHFVGFELTDDQVTSGDWFFVLQEQPTEPRFGLDDTGTSTGGALSSWSDASWQHTETPPGGHLAMVGGPLDNTVRNGVRWVSNGAHLATITLQKPARVAILGTHLL